MDVKASGRAALVIAAGLWMAGFWVMGSAQAAPAAESAASEKQTAKPQSAKKTAKPAVEKTLVEKPVVQKPVTEKTGRVSAVAKPKSASGKPLVEPAPLASANEADLDAPLPDSVANANAQIPVADAALAVAPKPAAEAPLVASDQLNDIDLAASAEANLPSTVGQSTGTVTAQAPHDDSLWGQTSLIGKIFIAFGGLLTAASAVRMFIV